MNISLNIKNYLDRKLLNQKITKGLYENNILKYEINDNTFYINVDNKSIIKDNKESNLFIDKNKCLLIVKDLNKKMSIPILSFDFIKKDNIIKIIYQIESLENNSITIKIEMEN